MGAKMVFMGRPALWGLAHSGEDGVKKILTIIKTEFDYALAISGRFAYYRLLNVIKYFFIPLFILGCASISDIRPCMVVHESYYSRL